MNSTPGNETSPRRLLTIGVPVFNEEHGIREFLDALDSSCKPLEESYPELKVELLVVDDGSTDDSVERIRSFIPRYINSIRIVRFSRNFGHPSATSALFDLADGDAMVVMDADMQDDPAIIPELVKAWSEGTESVRVRRGRRGEGVTFAVLSKGFNKLYSFLSGIEGGFGTYGLYGRRVMEGIRSFPEVIRYHPGMISLVGYSTKVITLDRLPRSKGRSRVGWGRLMRLALIAICSFSNIPIHLVSIFGLVLSLLSTIAGIAVIGIRLFSDMAIPGWASFLTTQFFLGGIIILSLGIIGQYIAILFEEVKARPRYFIRTDEVIHDKSVPPLRNE